MCLPCTQQHTRVRTHNTLCTTHIHKQQHTTTNNTHTRARAHAQTTSHTSNRQTHPHTHARTHRATHIHHAIQDSIEYAHAQSMFFCPNHPSHTRPHAHTTTSICLHKCKQASTRSLNLCRDNKRLCVYIYSPIVHLRTQPRTATARAANAPQVALSSSRRLRMTPPQGPAQCTWGSSRAHSARRASSRSGSTGLCSPRASGQKATPWRCITTQAGRQRFVDA